MKFGSLKKYKVSTLKICYIYPRFTGLYGGDRHLIHLANEMAKNNEVTIYTHKFNPVCSTLLSKQVKVIETGFINLKNHNIEALLDYFLMYILHKKIKNKYDIIVAFNWQSVFGAHLLKKRIKSELPVVYHCITNLMFIYKNEINVNPFYRILFGLIRLIDKNSIKSTNAIIANSKLINEHIIRIYGRNSYIIYPGIEVERFNKMNRYKARKIINISESSTIFITTGKLVKRKNMEEALKIYNKFQNNNTIYFIIGKGPDRQKLERLSAKLRLKNVRFLGELSDDEIDILLIAADGFIFTAKDEPFGLAPIEAAAAGCKIISNSQGGFREVLPKKCIISPEIINVDKIKENTKMDLSTLSWQKHAEKVSAIYEDLIKHYTRRL